MKTLETVVYLTDKPSVCRRFVSLPFHDDQAETMLQQRIDEHVQDGWRVVNGGNRLTKDTRTVEFIIWNTRIIGEGASHADTSDS